MFKYKFKKVICLLLILIMGISNIIPVFASDENESSEKIKNQSVVSEEKDEPKGISALGSFIKGSPFLTDAWEKQELDRADMIAMSLYMSSFTYPLIDNYKSTFVDSMKLGQRGKSADKIIFQKDDKQAAIQDFLNRIISFQSPELAEDAENAEGITSEKNLRDADDTENTDPRKITLRELLYGGDTIDEEAEPDTSKNFLLSSGKYVIGPTSNEKVIYDGSDKQKALLYIALIKTAKSEYTSDFEDNVKLLLDQPLFVDAFGNICVNGIYEEQAINEWAQDDDELDEELQQQVEKKESAPEDKKYNLSNIIVLPNCLNLNIVNRVNLYSSYFLNDNLVCIADKEGIYIGDYNFPASKKNDVKLVNRLEIGYQSKDVDLAVWDEISEKDEKFSTEVFEQKVKLTEPVYRYGFDLSKEIIYEYRDISGVSTKVKNILLSKNASSKYFNSLLNLNGWINSDIYVYDKRQPNYFGNRNVYLNWLLLVKPFYNSASQVNDEDYYTEDNLEASEIASSLFIDQNGKISELVNDLWNKTRDPEAGIDSYFNTITSIIIRIYESVISISFGSSYITTIPIISTIYGKIKENYHLILIVILGFITIVGISKGSIMKTIVKGILCMILVISLPTLYDKAIDIITSIKYVVLEKSINSWILSENIKYKGIEDISQMDESLNYTERSQAEKLDNTLLYIKGKSPIIINNVSSETTSSLQGSTVGSQIINNLLFQTTGNNDKIASFQDLFKRWDMIIPLWDNPQRDIAKSLKIENDEASTGKLIRKVAGSDEEDDNYSFTKYNDLTLMSDNIDLYYSQHENTRKSDEATEEELAYTSFAARDDYEQVIKDTRYKRQMTSQEFKDLYNLNITDDFSVLKQKYTLRQGIKDTFNIHDYFYYLLPLSASAGSEENKYTTKKEDVDIEGMKEGYKTILDTYFPRISANNNVEEDTEEADVRINNFNFYDSSKYDSNYGYFILTENVSPYFYTVWYDMLGNLTSQEIAYALMGKVNRDDEGNLEKSAIDGVTLTSRDSILMKDSKIIDYLDLKELFTNVVPYMNTVSLGAKEVFGDQNLSDRNSSRFNYYRDGKVAWLFETGWAEDLVKYYGDQIAKTDVYSEYQAMTSENGEKADNDFENLIQQFYLELTPLLEDLISVADREDVNKSVLLRQMTILSTLKFNSIFGIIGSNLQPKRVITESIPFDSLWVKYLRDQNYIKGGSNFLRMITANKTTSEAFIYVICAFILTLCYYYCSIVLLVVATLSFAAIFIKALRNATDSDEDYIPFMVGSVILIFKIAFLYIIPQFVIQLSLNLEIVKNIKTDNSIFVFLIYAFIYIFISNSLIPSLISPHVGKIKAFGVFNPTACDDDMGGTKMMEKLGAKIGNVGSTIRKVATGTVNSNSINATPTTRIVPTSAFKREEIKKENNKKPATATNFRNYRNDTANSSYQESFNNKAISDINKAIEADKKAGNSVLKPTVSSSQK